MELTFIGQIQGIKKHISGEGKINNSPPFDEFVFFLKTSDEYGILRQCIKEMVSCGEIDALNEIVNQEVRNEG